MNDTDASRVPGGRVLGLLLVAVALAAAEFPSRELRRGDLVVTVALPDPDDGYYQGIRFDHGGIVTAASYRGHAFLGVLKLPRDPRRHDGAGGAPEEFDMDLPPGFAEAADGGAFLKIGVGALVRPDRAPYRFQDAYAVAQRAAWTVEQAPDAVTCSHDIAAGARAVHGSRTIRLLPAGDGFVIERRLVNTGRAELAVEHYNHAMLSIDGQPIGSAYTLTFAAPVRVAHPRLAAAGPVVGFTEPTLAGMAWSVVEGLPAEARSAGIRVARGAVAVELSGDTAPGRLAIYAERTAVCPEVFTSLVLRPGEERRWSQTFRFTAP